MKPSRAVLLMLAGLAAGMGGRMALAWPEDAAKSGRSRTTEPNKQSLLSRAASKSAPRPAEADILKAADGTRLELLVAWLPEATEEELQRMAEHLLEQNPYGSLSAHLLIAHWAEVNPKGMLAWSRAAGRRHSDATGWVVGAAITAWAGVDFDSAWAAASDSLQASRTAALMGLASADPDKCLRFLREHPESLGLQGGGGIDEVLKLLAAHDPRGTAALLEHGTLEQRRRHAGKIVLEWLKVDPAATVEWLARLGPSVRDVTLEENAASFAKYAPEQIPALLESLPRGKARQVLESEVFARLASTNPAAAKQQLESMPAGPARQYARGLMMRELVQRGDDTAAAALAGELGWDFRIAWSPSYSAYESPQISGEGDNNEGEPILKAMARLFGRIAVRDPQEAAAILTNNPVDVEELISGDRTYPSDAIAAALQLAGDEKSLERLDLLLKNWAGKNRAAAASWSLAHGSPSLQKILNDWVAEPAAALAWAANLTPEQRLPLLQETVKTWSLNKYIDVAGAIRGSSLPAQEQQKLLEATPAP